MYKTTNVGPTYLGLSGDGPWLLPGADPFNDGGLRGTAEGLNGEVLELRISLVRV